MKHTTHCCDCGKPELSHEMSEMLDHGISPGGDVLAEAFCDCPAGFDDARRDVFVLILAGDVRRGAIDLPSAQRWEASFR